MISFGVVSERVTFVALGSVLLGLLFLKWLSVGRQGASYCRRQRIATALILISRAFAGGGITDEENSNVVTDSRCGDVEWRRRGWLVMLRARHQEHHTSAVNTEESWGNRLHRALPASTSSRFSSRIHFRQDPSLVQVLGDGVATPALSSSGQQKVNSESESAEELLLLASNVVQLKEEGVFRTIVIYL